MELISEYVRRVQEAEAAENERTIKELLGRWVSELEPCVVMQCGKIVGLCDNNAQIGDNPFILRI